MPKSLPLFSSFSSGEITPRLSARADIDAYNNGCQFLSNMISTSHGPAENRLGGQMIWWDEPQDPVVPKAIDGRVFSFGITKTYGTFVAVTLLDDGTTMIAPYSPNGVVIPPAIELVANGSFSDAGAGWTDTSSAQGNVSFAVGAATMVPGEGDVLEYASFEQEVSGTVNGNDLTLAINCPPGGGLLRIMVGTLTGLADIYDQVFTAQDIEVTFPNTGGTDVFLTLFQDGTVIGREINYISMYDSTINAPQDIPVKFVGPWTEQDIPLLQADTPPEGDVLYISSPYTITHKLTYDQETTGWTFEPVTFVGEPAEWVSGNYPGAITFYQGRMWLGGTPKQRETFWASKSGVLENFTQGSLDDDGLEFTINEHGAIQWVTGARNLIIGTATGEHIVESAGGVITPSDIEINQQSAYGSAAIQSEKIGQQVLYVSPDGRKVREIGYQWTDDGWISRDITFASEHITKDNPIVEIAFAQNPDNLLWCVTKSGNMVCCTYEKTYNVIGWDRHDTAGSYISSASVDINGSSIHGMMVKRLVNGDERIFFEIFNTEDRFIQDSWKYFYSEEPVAEIDGFQHLAGNSVQVLTDSGVHPDIVIDEDGMGLLQYSANEVICGFGFNCKMITLSAEVIGNEGATYSMNKSWNKIYVRVLDSAKPLINGVRPAERHPYTPMNTPEPLRSEDVEVMDLGWSKDNVITIEQDLPLPLKILGVFGEQDRENL